MGLSSPIKRSYAVKLVLLLFTVALLVGAIGGFIYFQTGEAVAEDTDASMTHATQLQTNTLENWAQNNHQHASAIATTDEIVGGDTAEVADALDREASRLAPGVDAVHYVDAGTGEVLESSGDAVGESYAATRWMELDRELPNDGESIVTTTYEDPTTGQPSVAFVAGVPGDDRIVVLPGDLEHVMTMLDRPTADEESFTNVVNSDGFVVVGHHADALNTQNMGPEDEMMYMSEGVDRGLDGETGTVVMNHHGEEIVMGYERVEGTDWVLMAHVPTANAYALQSDVQWSVASLILVAFFGLALVGLVVGRNTARSLRDLASTASDMEEGNLDVELETGREDEIGQLYQAFDSMRLSLREQIQEAQSARDEAEAERERIQEINRELEACADGYSTVMQQAADGDLTVRMDATTDNEAMAEIAAEFDEMLGEIEETVEELNAFAAEVATASEQVTASSEEVHSASEQISESVQEISVGAENQNESLQSVNREMSDLSTTTEEIAASSNDVADVAERTADTGSDGREAAEAAIEGMSNIEAESSQAVEEITQLEAEVGQIDELIERIQEIAHQTNMLALNANIEASRTNGSGGEDDAGFGAVAQEVKELSQDAKDAADEVEERLESIKEQTRVSAEEVEETSDYVDEASQHVEDAVDALEEIAEYAEETNTGVQEISAATEQQAASTQEVVAMVDEAATISEETTSEAEAAAAAAEEQTTALTEVSRSASELSQQASWLSEALDRFDTDADVEGGAESLLLGEDGFDPDVGSADAADERVDEAVASDIDAFDPGVDASDFGAQDATGTGGASGDDSATEPAADGAPETESVGQRTAEDEESPGETGRTD